MQALCVFFCLYRNETKQSDLICHLEITNCLLSRIACHARHLHHFLGQISAHTHTHIHIHAHTQTHTYTHTHMTCDGLSAIMTKNFYRSRKALLRVSSWSCTPSASCWVTCLKSCSVAGSKTWTLLFRCVSCVSCVCVRLGV